MTNQQSKENLPTNKKQHQQQKNSHLNQFNKNYRQTDSIDEMQQRSSVRSLRVRKLGHVETSDEEIVYRWLEENPSFVFEYFVSHATQFMVDQWMLRQNKLNNNGFFLSESTQPSTIGFRRSGRSASELLANDQRKNSLDPQMLGGSSHLLMRSFSCCDAPVTNKQVSSPMRKISAKQFECSTINLEPIFHTTNEGKLSFLPVDNKPFNSISLSPKKHQLISNRLSNSLSSRISDLRANDSLTVDHHHRHSIPHHSKHLNNSINDGFYFKPDFAANKNKQPSLIMQTPSEGKFLSFINIFIKFFSFKYKSNCIYFIFFEIFSQIDVRSS